MKTEPEPLFPPLDRGQAPMAFFRFFEFASTRTALVFLQKVVEVALRNQQEPALLLDNKCLTVRLAWPQVGQEEPGAMCFAEEIDAIPYSRRKQT